jgi:flagellar protein FlgJ
MATKEEQVNFVKKVYPAARKLYTDNPDQALNPVFVTAQAALETGWRIRGIDNNLFGITKGKSWTGRTNLLLTTEYFDSPNVRFVEPERVVSVIPTNGRYKYSVYRSFRAYDSLDECLADHLKVLMNPGYKDAWPYRYNPVEFVGRIVDNIGSKYATDPNYATTMTSMIRMVDSIVNKENI